MLERVVLMAASLGLAVPGVAGFGWAARFGCLMLERLVLMAASFGPPAPGVAVFGWPTVFGLLVPERVVLVDVVVWASVTLVADNANTPTSVTAVNVPVLIASP